MKKEFIEYVHYKKKLLSIIVRYKFKTKGTIFFTKKNFSQQVGYMQHKKNHDIPAHYHIYRNRAVKRTNEVLFIKSGKIRVDFFSNLKKYIFSKILEKGDLILLVSGGHGFKILKKTEMIEVKQGPYNEKTDKKKINKKIKKIIFK